MQGWMFLKVASGALIVASMLAAGPAGGQSINLATIKCRNFVELSKDTIATLTVWLDGYYTDEEDAAVFEPEKLKTNAEKLTAFCAQNPKMSVMTAAESVMAK
jgi:acid stress chaperone HdeB